MTFFRSDEAEDGVRARDGAPMEALNTGEG